MDDFKRQSMRMCNNSFVSCGGCGRKIKENEKNLCKRCHKMFNNGRFEMEWGVIWLIK